MITEKGNNLFNDNNINNNDYFGFYHHNFYGDDNTNDTKSSSCHTNEDKDDSTTDREWQLSTSVNVKSPRSLPPSPSPKQMKNLQLEEAQERSDETRELVCPTACKLKLEIIYMIG